MEAESKDSGGGIRSFVAGLLGFPLDFVVYFAWALLIIPFLSVLHLLESWNPWFWFAAVIGGFFLAVTGIVAFYSRQHKLFVLAAFVLCAVFSYEYARDVVPGLWVWLGASLVPVVVGYPFYLAWKGVLVLPFVGRVELGGWSTLFGDFNIREFITGFFQDLGGGSLVSTTSREEDEEPSTVFIGDAVEVLEGIGYGRRDVEHDDGRRLFVRDKRVWTFRPAEGEIHLDVLVQAAPHVLITGASGYGKSTLGRVFLSDIVRKLKKPVVVLDVHDEYLADVKKLGGVVFDPRRNTLSLWELEPGVSPGEKIAEMVEVFTRVLGLGDVQAIYLGKAAEKAYAKKGIVLAEESSWGRSPPSLREVIEEVDLLSVYLRGQEKGYALGLRRRLSMLELSGVFTASSSVAFETIVSKPTAFALGKVKSREAQAMFLEVFLRKLAGYMSSGEKPNGVRVFCLFDEAHRVCVPSRDGEPSFAGVVAREARKYGVGLIALSQSARELDKALVGNCSCTFCFYPKEPIEAAYVADLFSGGSRWEGQSHEIALELRRLGQFECMMVTTGRREPIVVKVVPPWEREEEPTGGPGEGVDEMEKAENAIVPRPIPSIELAEPTSVVREEQAILDKVAVMNPVRVTDLFNSIGGSKTAFYNRLNSLRRAGKVSVVTCPDLHGRMGAWVGLPNSAKSVGHSAYVRMLSDVLSGKGIAFTILDGKDVPDIEFEYGGQKIALEFESGKKNDGKLVKEMLVERSKRYKLVLVVVPASEKSHYQSLVSSLPSVSVYSLKEFNEFPIMGNTRLG